MIQCIARQSAIIQSATNKLKRNTQLLGDARRMCNTFNNEFKSASAKRSGEIQLIENVKKIVLNRYKDISSYVAQRGMASVEKW